MAINTSTITQLISDFRALSQKDSISPESLGVLLQKLADLINSAAADIDFNAISNALNNVPTALVSMTQGSANRNDVLMHVTTSNLIKGITMTLRDVLFIRQATSERAGAMSAQQVTDLDNTRTGLADLQKSVRDLSDVLSQLGTTVSENGEKLARVADEANYCSEGIADLAENLNVTNDDLAATQKSVEENAKGISSIKDKTDCPRIAVEVVDGILFLRNAAYYKEKGYNAYVFRFTSKRNRCFLENFPEKTRGAVKKGWHVIGGRPENIRIDDTGHVAFRTSPIKEWHALKDAPISYSSEPRYLVGAKYYDGNIEGIPYGRCNVDFDPDVNGYIPMRRFRYAIGFGKAYERDVVSLSPADLVSNLAEFSVIYAPNTNKLVFGK